jgi:hypothetical protein
MRERTTEGGMLPKDFRCESVNHNPPFIRPLVFDDHFKAQMNPKGDEMAKSGYQS